MIGLQSFIQGTCCNCPRGETVCIIRDLECKVLQGQRCAWFEKAVLPVAPENIAKQYTMRMPALEGTAMVRKFVERKCSCGVPLEPRQRKCPDCQALSRRKYYREFKKKERKENS